MRSKILNGILFILLFVMTIVSAILTARGLRSAQPPIDMASFEFTGTHEAASRMIQGWNSVQTALVRSSVHYDFLFIFCYSITLAMADAWAIGVFRAARSSIAILGSAAVAGPIVAGLCDAIENVSLLRLMDGAQGEFFPRVAMFAATIKFMLVGYGLLLALAGLIVRVNMCFQKKQ